MSETSGAEITTTTDQPVVVIVGLYGDRWHYRWWDNGYDYVRGEEPTRVKTVIGLQGCLPMLLSDHSRATLTRELRGPSPTV